MHSLARSQLGLATVAIVLAVSSAAAAANAAATGPDVTVIRLDDVRNYGVVSGERGYALGGTSCNVGTQPVKWCIDVIPGSCDDNEHPVIAQNVYRLKNGRFDQIGMSWLKHGFFSTNTFEAECGSCTTPPLDSAELGVGCTDTYDSFLNGSRPLGMRSEVNVSSGAFPYPPILIGAVGAVEQRIRIAESDLTDGAGERYFGEVHYVTADDALAGNGNNNASHLELDLTLPGFVLSLLGSTVREQAAVFAWQAIDPSVEILNVDIPASSPAERFHVARRVTDLGGGSWHYEYAVHNMSSDRSARSFRVKVNGATISNAGAHFVNHHSGEPYATTPWTLDTSVPGEAGWSTDTFATNANANALRWGTMFNFWFDATAGPAGSRHDLELFKPGTPAAFSFFFDPLIFADGFEGGDTAAWSIVVP